MFSDLKLRNFTKTVLTFALGIFTGAMLTNDLHSQGALYAKYTTVLNRINSIKTRNFTKEHNHNDDDSKAKELYNNVRVLVWVMTTGDNHNTKAIAVKNTWGKRANKLLFISDTEDAALPAINIGAEKGREHLTAKTMKAFDFIYQNFTKDYDWFMKADDDTYVIMENLRYMLSNIDSKVPIFFGQHFTFNGTTAFHSGGAGYVISKEALRRLGTRPEALCRKDGGAEDVEFGKCMEKLGVVTGDSLDSLNRTRFHCLNAADHILGRYPDWYLELDKYSGKHIGMDSMSDYAVTFHYVSPEHMYELEFFTYHLTPYGD